MKYYILSLMLCFAAGLMPEAKAQPAESMYGDQVKADVKLAYVYTLEEALQRAKAEKKPIFFNCFADWAMPCHAMNKHVFADQAFADYMNKTFVNLFIDVSKREHRALVEQFAIREFAHYLILDEQANVLLRIVGGKKLPEFQQDVMRALSPKTSLRGTEQAYQAGKRSKKDLLNYLYALDLTGDDKRYQQVVPQYIAKLSKAEYAKGENWKPFVSQITDANSTYYAHLIAHKADFVRANGAERVNGFIESLIARDIIGMAQGQQPYDASLLTAAFLQMQRASLPDSALSYLFYQVAKLRGEQRYSELIAYLQTQGSRLGRHRPSLELTLNITEAPEADQKRIAAYLRERSQQTTGSVAKELAKLATTLEGSDKGAGLRFENIAFAQALAKAKAESKQVFLDCYTTWCAPCKMMAKEVFPLPAVGEALNPHFVALKIDMEKGEGKELAKRYNVSAYPTMLVLDAEGNVVRRLVGAMPADELIKKALEQ